MKPPRIDPEFQALITPLKPEEREQLEANLVANGCRDSLVVWRGILIDGHNRYEICERRGVKYGTVEMALPSREHVLLWIEENQLGRRNLTDDQRATYAQSVKKRRAVLARSERAKAAGTAGGRHHPKRVSLRDTATPKLKDRANRSDVRAAKAAKVSERKIRAVDEIEKKAGPAAVARVRSGASTIQQERSAIRREERMERIAEMAAPALLPSDQKFPILYADPPWKYEYTETESRAIENQYPTMTLAEICALPVAGVCTKDAVLFLWVPNPKLADGLEVVKAWGFEYRTNMVWVKPQLGMGYYARQQHELLLIARRGDMPVPLPENRPGSVIQAPRQAHSAKPTEFYEAIERMYPSVPKLELFARNSHDGWVGWGNQIGRRGDAAS